MFESSPPQPNEHDHDLSDATISIRKAILYAESLWCTQRKTPTKNHRLPSCLFALHFKLSRKNRQPNDDDVVVSTPQRIMFTHDSKNNNNNNHKTDTSVLWPVLSVIPSSTAEDHYEIPIFDETISSSSSSSSPLVFRTQYLEPNQPCLLRGRQLLDKYFGSLHQQWRVLEPDTLVSSYYHHHTIIIHHVHHVKDGRHDLVVQNVANLLVQVSVGCRCGRRGTAQFV